MGGPGDTRGPRGVSLGDLMGPLDWFDVSPDDSRGIYACILGIQIFIADKQASGSTRGSPRGPRGPKNIRDFTSSLPIFLPQDVHSDVSVHLPQVRHVRGGGEARRALPAPAQHCQRESVHLPLVLVRVAQSILLINYCNYGSFLSSSFPYMIAFVVLLSAPSFCC